MRNKPLMRLAVCLIGMAALVLQSCADGGTDRDRPVWTANRTCWYIRKERPTR